MFCYLIFKIFVQMLLVNKLLKVNSVQSLRIDFLLTCILTEQSKL